MCFGLYFNTSLFDYVCCEGRSKKQIIKNLQGVLIFSIAFSTLYSRNLGLSSAALFPSLALPIYDTFLIILIIHISHRYNFFFSSFTFTALNEGFTVIYLNNYNKMGFLTQFNDY